MARRERNREDDDDLGFRTGAPRKKETSRRKKETGKHRSVKKKETGKHRSVKRKETGKHRSVKKKETGKHRSVKGERRERDPEPQRTPPEPFAKKKETPAAPFVPGNKLPLIAGLAAAGLLGGLLIFVMGEDEAQTGKIPSTPIRTVDTPRSTPSPIKPAPSLQTPRNITAQIKPPKASPGSTPAQVAPPPSAEPEGDALEELASRSATHAAIARILEEYGSLFSPEAIRNPGPNFENFRRRQQREAELLEEIRRMGPLAVDALFDMITGLEQRQQRIFMGKALAGIEGPEALEKVGDVLRQIKDVALQTTMARFLPETPEAAATLGGVFREEKDANLRCMLMREYHRRLEKDDDSGRELFRTAALDDPDPNVRAEAVTILGRRGDSRDQDIMEQIIRSEESVQIKKRAIVAYAETGGDTSLTFLEGLARDPSTSLRMRASAVLAIARVGGSQAIQTLDTIAQTDPAEEIRTRANRMAMSLRRREQEKHERADSPPTPLRLPPGTGSHPIDKH